jgi:hypothetical protein
MSTDPTQQPPTEEELRAAYEAELARVSVTDMVAQSAVSLLNLAARRLAPPPETGGPPTAPPPRPTPDELEQARDAIDAVRALLEILERRIPQEVASLRDALSQLQLAYAAQAQAAGEPAAAPGGEEEPDAGTPPAGGSGQPAAERPAGEDPRGPGPAESSGRLWVPGR